MTDMLQLGIEFVERGWIPDSLTRSAIRRLCADRAKAAVTQTAIRESEAFQQSLRHQSIALHPEKANEQHYELSPRFFELVLGPRRKYSCCHFSDTAQTLEQAEDEALRLTCEHADLQDGHEILELGCGWGSLSLWMAEKFPNSQITAISNSAPQRLHIESVARERSFENLRVVTADVNEFAPGGTFDRIVSVEMFEHVHNYERLLQRISTWLQPDGKLFVHHFCHRSVAYPFQVDGSINWMGKYFFTGGLMPSADLLSEFNNDLIVTQSWKWNGQHYERTSNEWLKLMDQNREAVLEVLRQTYGKHDAQRWFQRWRMFFLAVAELFGYAKGTEWFVAHLLLEPVAAKLNAARPFSAVEAT